MAQAGVVKKEIYFGPQPNNYVISMARDSLGRLWIGTEAGLVWYDGNRFFLPTPSSLIANEYINRLIVLNADSMLVLAWDKTFLVSGLKRLPCISDITSRFGDLGYNNGVVIRKKVVLISSSDSAMTILDHSLKILEEKKFQYVPAALSKVGENLVIAFHGGIIGFYGWKGDSLVQTDEWHLPPPLQGNFFSLWAEREYVILAPGESGLYVAKKEKDKVHIQRIKKSENIIFYDILEDPLHPGKYWAGSYYRGLYYFDQWQILENERFSADLTNSMVNSVLVDSKGGVIAGTQFGFTYFYMPFSEVITQKEGLSSDFVWIIYPYHGQLIVGTTSGANVLEKNDHHWTVVPHNIGDYFRNSSIFHIAEVNDTLFFASTKYPGYHYYYRGYIGPLDDFPDKKGYDNIFLKADSRNRLWFGGGRVIYRENGKYHILPFPEGEHQRWQVYAIEELSDGRIVYGTINGLFVTDGKSVEYLIPTDSIRINVTNLFMDPLRQKLLIGSTGGAGLYEYDLNKKTVEVSPFVKHIAGNDVFYLHMYGDSLYIFGTSLGLSFYFVQNDHWYYLNTANGLINDEINTSSLLLMKDDVIVGTAAGIQIFESKTWMKNMDMPRVYLPLISPEIASEKLVLPWRNNYFSAQVGIIHSSPVHMFTIVYRFRGLEENWIPLQSENITVRNLSPGEYTLELKAFWRDSVFASKPYQFAFTVYRPFWYGWHGVVMGILLLGILVYSGIRYRTHRLSRLSEILTEKLQQEQRRSLVVERMLTELFQQSSMGIIFTALTGEVISFNPAAVQLGIIEQLDWSGNILQTPLFSTLKTVRNSFLQVSQGETEKLTLDVEVEKNGNRYYYHLYFWKFDSQGEERIGIFISDLSAVIHQKNVEARMQAFQQILATLSHYLNNTMAILGLAEENYQLDPKNRHEKLAMIARHTVKKVKFILELLERTVASENIQFRDYVDAKNLLIDIEEEIRKFNQENKLSLN